MDELDFLKKNWKQQETSIPQLTQQQLNPLLVNRSSSILKWIWIFSVIELLFWPLLSVVMYPFYNEYELSYSNKWLEYTTMAITIVYHFILLYFIYSFYQNFKKIDVVQTTKDMIQHILKARRSVRYYVLFNLTFFVFSFIYVSVLMYFDANLKDVVNLSVFIGVLSVIIVTGALILSGFYWIIYGRLTKKLKRNYELLTNSL